MLLEVQKTLGVGGNWLFCWKQERSRRSQEQAIAVVQVMGGMEMEKDRLGISFR